MTTTVITSLPDLGTISDITYIPVETSGVTQKISGLTIKNYIKSTLSVATSTSFSGDMTIGGTTTMNGDVTIGGNLTVSGTITSSGLNTGVINATMATISGTTTMGGVAIMSSDATIAGNLTVGAKILSASLTTTNATVNNLIIGTSIIPSSNAAINIGDSSHWFGSIYGESSSAKYADLAEKYSSDSDYEPGTVVSFGDETEVTISKTLSDVRVAGVVTTKPAYLMNAEAEGVAVALVGRVPCKVIGKIRRGDMLVSSDIRGVATYNGAPQMGTVIGKALGNYDNETEVGVIEVVVGRL